MHQGLIVFVVSMMNGLIERYVSLHFMHMVMESNCVVPSTFGMISSLMASVSFVFVAVPVVSFFRKRRWVFMGCLLMRTGLNLWVLGGKRCVDGLGGLFVATMMLLGSDMLPIGVMIRVFEGELALKDAKGKYYGMLNWVRNGFTLICWFIPMLSNGYLFFVVLNVVFLMGWVVLLWKGDEYDLKKDAKVGNQIVNILIAFQNPAFRWLLFLFCYDNLRSLLYNNLYYIYLKHVLGLHRQGEIDSFVGLMHIVSLVLSMYLTPLGMNLSKKYGLYRIWLISYAIQMPIGCLIYSFCRGDHKIWIYVILSIVNLSTVQSSSFLLDEMKLRVHKYDEESHGQKHIDVSVMLWSKIPRLFSIPSSFFSLQFLEFFGFQSGQKVQSKPTIEAIAFFAAAVPSITSVGCFIIMAMFPLKDKTPMKSTTAPKIPNIKVPNSIYQALKLVFAICIVGFFYGILHQWIYQEKRNLIHVLSLWIGSCCWFAIQIIRQTNKSKEA